MGKTKDFFQVKKTFDTSILPERYINFGFIKKRVFSHDKNAIVISKPRFLKLLEESEEPRVHYILTLLEIGSAVQDALTLLETKKKLKLDKLLNMLVFTLHPTLIASGADMKIDNYVTKRKELTEKDFLVWNEVFRDTLLHISELIRTFVICCDNLALPAAFSDTEDT